MERPLIKAHIIPKSFFIQLRKGRNPAKIISQNGYPKKSQIGEYDKEILCNGCEKKFQSWDDYGQKLLLQESDQLTPIKNRDEVVAYEINKFDYSRLKLFFLSLLWRASVSSRDYYALVDLGTTEAVVRNYLDKNTPGSADEFSVILARFNNRIGKLTMLNPHSTKFNGMDFFVFYLTGYIAYIKNGIHPISNDLRKFQISPGQKLILLSRDFDDSNEKTLMESMVRNSHKLNRR